MENIENKVRKPISLKNKIQDGSAKELSEHMSKDPDASSHLLDPQGPAAQIIRSIEEQLNK